MTPTQANRIASDTVDEFFSPEDLEGMSAQTIAKLFKALHHAVVVGERDGRLEALAVYLEAQKKRLEQIGASDEDLDTKPDGRDAGAGELPEGRGNDRPDDAGVPADGDSPWVVPVGRVDH